MKTEDPWSIIYQVPFTEHSFVEDDEIALGLMTIESTSKNVHLVSEPNTPEGWIIKTKVDSFRKIPIRDTLL